MIGYMLWSLLVISACAAWLGACAWLSDESVMAAVALLVVGLSIGTGLLLWQIAPEEGEHRWKGGAGPATVCRYEVEDGGVIMAGKVPVETDDELYTVCVEPER